MFGTELTNPMDPGVSMILVHRPGPVAAAEMGMKLPLRLGLLVTPTVAAHTGSTLVHSRLSARVTSLAKSSSTRTIGWAGRINVGFVATNAGSFLATHTWTVKAVQTRV